MDSKFLSKDQNWQNEETVYWFQIEGEDYGTGVSFDGETFGVVESAGTTTIVDGEGTPLEGDYREIAVRKALDGAVTDELRAE